MPEATHTNSLGMEFVPIEPGRFLMGNDAPLHDDLVRLSHWRYGDFDERPVHRPDIKQGYHIGTLQVTNSWYEQFDPSHRDLRGKLGMSAEDDEAVIFVSWYDAVAFCDWLSEKEGRVYRLPTETEWEYAARAGTTTAYHTGDTLPDEFAKNARMTWFPDESRTKGENVVPLHVGRTPPNSWGLYDVHGNVEEWCSDWYAPYDGREHADPLGPADGDFRVTRGGSHSTELYYLRSSNRMGALPEESNWLIGFRVVMGEPAPFTWWGHSARIQLNRSNVVQTAAVREEARRDPSEPYFAGPRRYVNIPDRSFGPAFSYHNHDPAICECPNGDILAIWYTCVEEPGRELGIVASRLRAGADEWETASSFWDAPDRNDHAPALLRAGDTLYHFNGLSAAATWGPLATILRTSTDSGSTWSKARYIISDHGPRHMPIASAFQLRDGTMVVPCDAVSVGGGGTALWMSDDDGARSPESTRPPSSSRTVD